MHILVAEHNPERARAMAAVLQGSGHRAEIVASGAAALTALARPARPELLLVEEELPDMSAGDLLLSAARMNVAAPAMLLGSNEAGTRWLEATRLGALDYVPLDSEGVYLTTMAARVEAVRRRAASRARAQLLADALESTSAAVLLTDADGRVRHANAACRRLLGQSGTAPFGTLRDVFALEGQPRLEADLFGAVAVAGEWAGEVHVQRQDGERVPCIVTLSPIRGEGAPAASPSAHGGLVLTLRDVSERVAMEDALRAANRRLAEQAARDPLTGLYNRAYFREVLDREVARTLRYGGDCAVLMIDLDNFKRVNDEEGHAMGDTVLTEISVALGKGLRDGDVLARFGGDEFCVLLPNTARAPARSAAERLRALVAERPFGPTPGATFTASVGIATSADVAGNAQDPSDDLVRLADRALFVVKRDGGNGIRAHGD